MMKFLSVLLAAFNACVPVSPLQAQQGGIIKPETMVMIELKAPAEHSDEISADYVLSKKGTIRLPRLSGEIQAGGIMPGALARRIEAAYREEGVFKNPSVNVYLPSTPEIPQRAVMVSGEIQTPGKYPLRKGMRLLDAISKGGGMTAQAKSSAVKLIRGKKTTTIYDIRKIKGDGSNNPMLQKGDSIIIPSG